MMKISKVRAVLMGVALAATGFCANAQVIGLSNGYFGTEWRNQMIDGAKEQFAMYKAKGMATGLVIQQSGTNTGQQIQDIRNMIQQGVGAIMVDAHSATALKTGRASCRERGCQYVEISGVGVSLKKKK